MGHLSRRELLVGAAAVAAVSAAPKVAVQREMTGVEINAVYQGGIYADTAAMEKWIRVLNSEALKFRNMGWGEYDDDEHPPSAPQAGEVGAAAAIDPES